MTSRPSPGIYDRLLDQDLARGYQQRSVLAKRPV
jgi:hypothetical protein